MSYHLFRLAATIADRKHREAGQFRKGSGEPYIKHCLNVARTVKAYGGDSAMVVAAILHDTKEDTSLTLKTISLMFGEDVADLVEGVSEVSRPEDGSRAARKALDMAHYASGDERMQTIKLADILDNVSDITTLSPNFARTYLKEKADLAAALTKGPSELRSIVQFTISGQQAGLEQAMSVTSKPKSSPPPAGGMAP